MTLHYTKFKQITDDIDDARVYGGIHFRFDQEAGARLGRRMATRLPQQPEAATAVVNHGREDDCDHEHEATTRSRPQRESR